MAPCLFDSTSHIIVLVPILYINVLAIFTPADSRFSPPNVEHQPSNPDELLLLVRVGTGPGLKLEEVAVVEVKALV